MLQSDTKLDILNECIAHTGGVPMSDPENSNNITERWALNRFDIAVEQALELRPWAGAIAEASIPLVTGGMFSDLNHYQCPSDLVRVNYVKNLTETDWNQAGQRVVTGVKPAALIIAYNSTKTMSTWGAHLRALMGLMLAIKVSYAVSTSATKKRELEQLYMRNVLIASGAEGSSHSGYVWGAVN
ncbi:MAG: hypothetical protein COA69_13415 [Robiginitomaculum sp.]|nr:MAG: hypothetical protein COA69_13415 [Robiginitomaculum sp.]